MSVSKIKTAVIIILAVLNVILLSFVLHDERSEASMRARELTQLSEIYTNAGVTLADSVKILPSLPTVNDARDTERERDFVETFLGETTVDDVGGGAYLYSSEHGSAFFRDGGEFSIRLMPNVIRGERTKAWVEHMMRNAKTDVYSVTETENGLIAVQACGSTEITNCEIGFTFENGELVTVSGRLATSFSGGRSSMSCVTAMTRFLTPVRSGEISCKTVSSVRPVYCMDTTVSGSTLYGVWQIETDGGIYTVNAATGEILTKG